MIHVHVLQELMESYVIQVQQCVKSNFYLGVHSRYSFLKWDKLLYSFIFLLFILSGAVNKKGIHIFKKENRIGVSLGKGRSPINDRLLQVDIYFLNECGEVKHVFLMFSFHEICKIWTRIPNIYFKDECTKALRSTFNQLKSISKAILKFILKLILFLQCGLIHTINFKT